MPSGNGTGAKKRSRSPSRSHSPPRKRSGAASRIKAPVRRPESSTNSTRNARRDDLHHKRPRSPSRSPSRSPPRQLKRPGQAARISAADREAARRRQQEREREQEEALRAEASARGVHDVVKQHYNAVPERGRTWRKTDSKIKGLRSFNNWVKSTLIQKFSPGDESVGQGKVGEPIRVLDIGCGKGGDLQKWGAAPKPVDLYVGVDPADVSIEQARERYQQMKRRTHRGRAPPPHDFHCEFHAKDCFGEWLGDIPIIKRVGIDPSVGPDADGMAARWGGGGFDVVSMMFCMHYAFESETKARGMLKNVAGALQKGGRFLGVIPNSDVLSEKVEEHHKKHQKAAAEPTPAEPTTAEPTAAAAAAGNPADDSEDDWDPEKSLDDAPKKVDEAAPAASDQLQDLAAPPAANQKDTPPASNTPPVVEFGNSIFRVKFPGQTPPDGIFRPPFGWKYFYFLEEAVETVPEYVVPWEAFRALAEEYNLELQYRKPFKEVWEEERDDRELGPLSERMGVRERSAGRLLVGDEEMDAAGFYHAFCFYKV